MGDRIRHAFRPFLRDASDSPDGPGPERFIFQEIGVFPHIGHQQVGKLRRQAFIPCRRLPHGPSGSPTRCPLIHR